MDVAPIRYEDCKSPPEIEQELFYPFKWFRWCYEDLFEKSLFEAEFDEESGYGVYEKPNLRVHLITQESNRKTKQDLINSVIGGNGCLLNDTNIASEKWYNDLYMEVQ